MMNSEQVSALCVLTPVTVKQIDEKVSQAIRCGYATVTLVVEKGRLRWIRGPAPSEPVRGTDRDKG